MSEASSQGNLFCFGLGFSSGALAKRLIPEDWVVSGTCRDNKSKELIKELGITVYSYNGTRASSEIYDAIHKAHKKLLKGKIKNQTKPCPTK